ncbi:MAG: hypothetical protein E7358_02020 [Clostridiales bacterium]|nr:hypothetical protein [Clostridiales bacterium]
MKKLKVILSLIAICVLSTFMAFATKGFFASADEDNKIELEAFLPSSNLQLYDLKSPLSISYSESGFMVITEHIGNTDGTSDFDRVSVFNPETERFTAIPSHHTIYNVTHAQEWNGYVFYLSSSTLYCVPANKLGSSPIDTGIKSSNFFMIKGDYLLTNTNNTIEIYTVNKTESIPKFTSLSSHNFTTKNAFISNENNVYYLFAGKLYCFDTASSTSYVVTNLNFDVNYMTEMGDYIYLTSIDGIFKVEKGKNKQPILVVNTDQNAKELGSFVDPQGATVMGDMILIADPTLKCVQAITSDGEFTDFAITTESTADYRLTNSASILSVSENFTYVLDDGASDENGKVYKRIVKTAIDKTAENRYLSISLKPLYQDNEKFEVKLLACSDSHMAIYHDKYLDLFDISNKELKKVYTIESESVTALTYLDGEFYYTDYALYNFGYNVINVNKIIIPSEDNGYLTITKEKVNENTIIRGVAHNLCVDVFGNVYMTVSDTVGARPTKLIRYSSGKAEQTHTVSVKFNSIRADFAGNVYGLTANNIVYKFSYQSNSTAKQFEFDTTLPIKDIELNYRSNTCYALSNACILKSKGDTLGIENIIGVGSDSELNTVLTNVESRFITIDKQAKLFKVTLGDYNEDGSFKSITSIRNPSPDKVYFIVSEIDNYFLVSYSAKFVALVRKTATNYAPNQKYTSAIIGQEHFDEFNIKVEDVANKQLKLTNSTTVFSRPLFDNFYMLDEVIKGQTVYAIKDVTFNGKTMTLVSLTDGGKPYGYVLSGYLSNQTNSGITISSGTDSVVTSDGRKHFNNVLMIGIIALTITLIALFIEKKLLFDKEDGNKQ